MDYFHGKKLLLFLCFIGSLFCFIGCSETEKEFRKVKELEFTVVEEADVPQELLAKINEKKQQPFSMNYVTEGYLYIVQGYGEQPSGGYSITVKELFLAEDAVVFQSELLGPSKDELVRQVTTYPYIVVKLQDMGVDVVVQ